MVDVADVYDFLGTEEPPIAQVVAALDTITAMVRTYVRGVGFDPVTAEPASDITAVITTATCRLLANPEQLGYDVGGVGYRGGFVGWSLAEQMVLNAYRRRAA